VNTEARAEALRRLRTARSAGLRAAAIPRRPDSGPTPVTPAQRGIWLHEQSAAGLGMYHVVVSFRVTGELNAGILRRAVWDLLGRQDALRTTFHSRGGQVRAEVAEPGSAAVDWRLRDLRLLSAGRREAAADRVNRAFATEPFDLAAGPPVRWCLVRLADAESLFSVAAHHLAMDGWSLGVLIDEVWAGYAWQISPTAEPPQPPAVQFADYAMWLSSRPQDPVRAESGIRRANLLRDVPPLELAVGCPRPPVVSHSGSALVRALPQDVCARMRASAAGCGVTPFAFLLACYQMTLAKHSGQVDFAVGIPVAGRDHDEVSRVIGHFVNTVAIRSDLPAASTFEELVLAVHLSALAAYDDERVPFEDVAALLEQRRDPRFSPVFQAMFVQQALAVPDLSVLGLSLTWHPVSTEATLYDLVLHVVESVREPALLLTYSTALIDAERAGEVLDDFVELVSIASAEPSRAVHDLLLDLPIRLLKVRLASSLEPSAAAGALREAADLGGLPLSVAVAVPPAGVLLSDPADWLVTRDDAVYVLLLRQADTENDDARTAGFVDRLDAGCRASGAVCLLVLCDPMDEGTPGLAALARRAAGLDTVIVLDAAAGPGSGDPPGLGWLAGRALLDWAAGPAPAAVPFRLAAWLAGVNPRGIPDQRSAGPETRSLSDEPAGPSETRLAELWAQALGLPSVGRYDDFFLLGGGSLTATALLSGVRDEFGVDLPLRELFARPTVASFAAEYLAGSARSEGVPGPVPVSRGGGDLMPVSFAQQRLWLLDRIDPGNPAYNIPLELRLRGCLDAAAMESALADIERRHEVLRTVFADENGQPRQAIRSDRPRPLEIVDLRTLPAGERRTVADRVSGEAAAQRFDLVDGPLWRYRLIRLADEDHRLLITMHHAVSDGWSVAVLCRELSAYYAARVAGVPADLPDLPIQYADYSAWQRGAAARLGAQAQYWHRQLADAPVIEIHPGRPLPPALPPARTSRGASERLTVPDDVTAAVRKVSAAHGATPFMVLIAAFYVLLHRDTRQHDLVVGVPVAARTRSETQPLIGCFLNVLPLRVAVDPGEPFTVLLRRVRGTALAAFANQEYSLGQMIEELELDQGHNGSSFTQVLFNHLNTPPPVFTAPGLEADLVRSPRDTTKFDIELTVDETGAQTVLVLEYSADLYGAAKARLLLRHYLGLLAEAARAPGSLVGKLPFESGAQAQSDPRKADGDRHRSRSPRRKPGAEPATARGRTARPASLQLRPLQPRRRERHRDAGLRRDRSCGPGVRRHGTAGRRAGRPGGTAAGLRPGLRRLIPRLPVRRRDGGTVVPARADAADGSDQLRMRRRWAGMPDSRRRRRARCQEMAGYRPAGGNPDGARHRRD